MTRDWVVGKRNSTCGNSRCESYNTKCKTVTLNKTTGEVRALCATCGQVSTRQCREWRETKACAKCGHQRTVIHWKWPGEDTPRFRKFCNACELLGSAANHRAQADAMEKKARAIYAKRKGATS